MDFVYLEANHDPDTSFVHYARRAAYSWAKSSPGREVTELFGAKATAVHLQSAYLALPGYFTVLSGMGHGNEDEFCGQNDYAVLGDGASGNLTIKNTIVHLYSCNTGNGLGARLIAKGAKAFIGYTDFVSVPDTNVLNAIVIRESTAIDKALYEGKTSQQTKIAADAAYATAYAELTLHPSATFEDIAALERNHAALTGPWNNMGLGSF